MSNQKSRPGAVAAASTDLNLNRNHYTTKPDDKQTGTPARLAYDARGLSRALGVSLRHVRRLDAAGRLPSPIRLGRAVRWLVREIESWLAAGCPDRQSWQSTKDF